MKTVIKSASDLRKILERDYTKLDSMGFPFINMFPYDCCRGNSVFLALIANKYYPKNTVHVVLGKTRDKSKGHYWVEINDKVYDITIEQFSSWDNLKEQCPVCPIYALHSHPLESYFCHKVRYSPVQAFSLYCSESAMLKDVITMNDLLINKLKELGWS
ncbi:hypothetical protein [Morganella morganii]|uniref:hypothetical protein n=1 Tax=Morganella morganii TaxID=582 RepID=UPI0023683F72|nr:hypothetical protein [Morganella morganii]